MFQDHGIRFRNNLSAQESERQCDGFYTTKKMPLGIRREWGSRLLVSARLNLVLHLAWRRHSIIA